jgi:hypothetical protein
MPLIGCLGALQSLQQQIKNLKGALPFLCCGMLGLRIKDGKGARNYKTEAARNHKEKSFHFAVGRSLSGSGTVSSNRIDGIALQANLRRQRELTEKEPPISGKRHGACRYFFAIFKTGNASSKAA